MHVQTIAAAVLATTLLPATALADLQVNATGFQRVVTSSTQGETCDVQQVSGGVTIDCPDGSRGTMVLYGGDAEGPACEVDFWYGMGNDGAQQWRAIIPRRNGAYGTCTMHWPYANLMELTLQPPA